MNIASKDVRTNGYTVGHTDTLQLPPQDVFYVSLLFFVFFWQGEVTRAEGRYEGVRGCVQVGCMMGNSQGINKN